MIHEYKSHNIRIFSIFLQAKNSLDPETPHISKAICTINMFCAKNRRDLQRIQMSTLELHFIYINQLFTNINV